MTDHALEVAQFAMAIRREGGLLNATDAGLLIGVSRQRMMKLRATGGTYGREFTPFRFFGRAYFSKAELDNYARERKTGRPTMTLARRFWVQENRCANATIARQLTCSAQVNE
jgi:hypothetical protein